MKHIGDNYYQFKCTCGENILLQGGDIIHHNKIPPETEA
jgi:hypothetical protein